MKHIKINSILLLVFAILNSCTADFIEEKKVYSAVDVGIYQEEYLAKAYVDHVYYLMLPDGDANMTMWSKAAAEHSGSDLFTRSTDEIAGGTVLNREWSRISPLDDNCLKSLGTRMSSSPGNNAYTRIRYCNLYLNYVDDYEGLEEGFKNQIKGQMYFWRAWQYFELVRLYGGVPLVLVDQPANVDDPGNQTPRSPSSETFEQIVSDLDMAKDLLEKARPYTAEDAGRITAAAAAALKGRALLTWASPQFNPSDDQSRWQQAYDANLEAYNLCLASGKGLNPDWKNMWFDDNGMESVFAFGFNDYADNSGAIQKNNYTEFQTRSRDQEGNGGVFPTKNIVDAFPMADGTPYNPNGNLNHFYRDRDPRFYYTFAYNGAIWPYAGNSNYKNWTYYWYPLAAGPDAVKIPTNIPSFGHGSGIYLRKFTNDNSSSTNNFKNNGADYMEIRFAEVVLNLAESAVGVNKLAEGKGYIAEVRARAGITNNDGSYGLATVSSRDGLFAACINERKVEFAYENKRFHDLRRWLLYNNDSGTCTRLNQTPIEGMRRQGYYTFAKLDANTIYENGGGIDPFKGPSAPIINRDATTYPPGVNSYEEYVDYLYDNHFEVVVGDDLDATDFTFKWYNEYYFFGIHQDLMVTAPYLQQTRGWGGSFDPLN